MVSPFPPKMSSDIARCVLEYRVMGVGWGVVRRMLPPLEKHWFKVKIFRISETKTECFKRIFSRIYLYCLLIKTVRLSHSCYFSQKSFHLTVRSYKRSYRPMILVKIKELSPPCCFFFFFPHRKNNSNSLNRMNGVMFPGSSPNYTER